MLLRLCSKILQARLKNQDLPGVQAGLRKGRGTKIKLPTFTGSQTKQGNSRNKKKTTSASLTMGKSITTNWKILRDGNTRPSYLSPEKPVCWSGSNS